MSRGYIRGRYAEERLVAKLSRLGWTACRIPMSGGAAQVDVEAIKPNDRRLALIEVKSTSKNRVVVDCESVKRMKGRFECWYRHIIRSDWRVEFVLAVLWRVKSGRGFWVMKDIGCQLDGSTSILVRREDRDWSWTP
ncbi:MAG: hypothetical protein QXW94_06075 [Desulfurococcaceae archaeon]